MGKYSCLCLPKQENASRTFACIKLFLLLLFSVVLVYEIILTIINIRVYRARVYDIKISSVFPSRSEIQVESTHAHFFLFTGLMNGAAIMCGFWAVLMEYLVALVAYVYIHGTIIGFEVIGAWMSNDLGVATRKGAAILPEPLLVLMALVFAHMVRVAEKQLASSPLYRKKMAARAGKGETAAHADYQLSKEIMMDKERQSKHLQGVTVISSGRLAGSARDNPAMMLDHDDGDGGRRGKVPASDDSSSGNSSRSHSLSSAASQDVTVLTSDGRTRIAINAAAAAASCPAPHAPVSSDLSHSHGARGSQ